MTEQQFVDWCTSDTWAEWVDGEVIVMSPVNTLHARLLSFLIELFRAFAVEHDLGEVFNEPYQVRFAKRRRRRSPDILFVSSSRLNIITDQHVEGAPDLTVEIVSPQSQSRDRRDKYNDYEAAGVREYWIIDPLCQSVEAYALSKNKKYAVIHDENGAIPSTVLPGFYLKPAWLWRAKPPKVSDLLKEMSARR
jgi:Uma2 family endonuclease